MLACVFVSKLVRILENLFFNSLVSRRDSAKNGLRELSFQAKRVTNFVIQSFVELCR